MTREIFTERHFLADSADWRTDRYYTYDLLTALLRGASTRSGRAPRGARSGS
jgi:putative salt-induced outer membrane protein YdiY